MLLASGGAGLVLFLSLVLLHRDLRQKSARERLKETISREARTRLERRWEELPDPVTIRAPSEHPYAGDLDVCGRASLAHLLGRVTTAPGKTLLAHALLNPLAVRPSGARELLGDFHHDWERPETNPGPDWIEDLRRRQDVVRTLAREGPFRERLELLVREGQQSRGTPGKEAAFLAWLEEPRWLENHPGLLIIGRFLGVFTPISLTAWLLGWAPGLLPVLGAISALVLYRFTSRSTSAILRAAEAARGVLGGSAAMIGAAEDICGDSSLLDELRRTLRTPSPGARRSIHRLVRLADLASVRESVLHVPLVALCSWDIHVVDRLERWHTRYSAACRKYGRAGPCRLTVG